MTSEHTTDTADETDERADGTDASDLTDTWAAESYDEMATQYLPMAGRLVDETGVGAGDRVLDVACGTGNVAVTAARAGADVTGVDITPGMLARAETNAEVAGVEGVDWRKGDATDLPFEDGAFDIALSNLGHMYGDPPADAARELLRVTRSGGRIGFTSWTPTSLFPAMGQVLVTSLVPEDVPEFTEPPFMWGDEGVVEDRLGEGVDDLAFEARTITYAALSPAHFWREMAANSGTFVDLLEKADDDERPALDDEMVERVETHFDDHENGVTLKYLLTTATVAADGAEA